MHLVDELGHPLLQLLEAFFINGVCLCGCCGTNGLEALVLWLFDSMGNHFSDVGLTTTGQHVVVDVGTFEMDIPFYLQFKLKLPFFFHVHGRN